MEETSWILSGIGLLAIVAVYAFIAFRLFLPKHDARGPIASGRRWLALGVFIALLGFGWRFVDTPSLGNFLWLVAVVALFALFSFLGGIVCGYYTTRKGDEPSGKGA